MIEDGTRESNDRTGFDESAFAALYKERCVDFHYEWSLFFITHMSALHRRFGDLEDALLLTAVGIGPAAAKLKELQAKRDRSQRIYGAPAAEPAVTNAVRLSELTGIPRQTVRRKLNAFAQRGWLEQMPNRSWRLTRLADGSAAIASDLAETNTAMVRELARLLGRFDRIARSHVEQKRAADNPHTE